MAPKTKGKKSVRGRPRQKRAARKGQRKVGVPERASCVATQVFELMQTNQLYTNYNTQLSGFTRAINIAKGYQFYRIKKITYKFSPLSDTFQAGSGVSVPYLYFMIDRNRQLVSANTANALRLLGAKPKRLDDRIVTWVYKPSVLTGTYDSLPPAGQGTTQFTQHKVSPWLACRDTENQLVWNPDSTDHLGAVWLAENSGGALISYKCERIVEFEFKKPAYSFVTNPTAPAPIDVEDIIRADDFAV